MILAVLGLLVALAAAVGTAGPMAADAVRQGRDDFLELVAERAAEGRLVEWFEEPWVDSTVGGVVGSRIPLAAEMVAGLRLERVLECVAPSVWILEVRASIRDSAGGVRAQIQRGLLVRTDSLPGDSTVVGRLVSRPWVAGFQ